LVLVASLALTGPALARSVHPQAAPARSLDAVSEHFDPSGEVYNDPLLSRTFGLAVGFYNRENARDALAFGAPGEVALSMPLYEYLGQFQELAAGTWRSPPLSGHMAHAVFALAHELGHAHSRHPSSEDAANAWAAAHFNWVAGRLGADRALRHRLFSLARAQLLV
jgi:hypothetical protein